MCKLQTPSQSVYNVMTEADQYSLNCVAVVPGPQNTVHKWKLKMLHLVLSPQYLTLLL